MPGRGKPFPKGRNGNPGGRPKSLADFQEYARQHTRTAINVLAVKASPAARIAAANALLDRGYGKPTSIVDARINEKLDALDWTTHELRAFLNGAIPRTGIA